MTNNFSFSNLAVKYLFLSGVLIHLVCLSVFYATPIYFAEPGSFFWDKVIYKLKDSKDTKKQKIASWALKSGLFNDWNHLDQEQLTFLSPIATWKGQGASSKKNRKNALLTSLSESKTLFSSEELLSAINSAQPGDILTLAAGTYTFKGKSLKINRPGRKDRPITIQSSELGLVTLKFDLLEGFHVKAPYWNFENLNITGSCVNDSRCEHAFHIVGNAKSITIKNNIISNFNAHIKVNGVGADFPDDGLIEQNTFYNTATRNTGNPVTLLNIDSVNHWVVRGNLIADFAKGASDKISYGAFMKGNGRNGVFENNLIICEMNLPADKGVRIGLSFGGGGTGKQFCRNKNCSTEFTNGTIRNNIIAHCSRDVGIYLNKASDTLIYNNLLFNNLGIDVRFSTSDAVIFNNMISGRIKKRNDGRYIEKHNLIDSHCLSPIRNFSDCSFSKWFWDISNLDLALTDLDASILGAGTPSPLLTKDFCNTPIKTQQLDIGPIQYSQNKKCSPIDL